MPSQSKAVDKFQLIDIISTIIRAIEEDAIKTGKVSFNLTAQGIYNVSIFFLEK